MRLPRTSTVLGLGALAAVTTIYTWPLLARVTTAMPGYAHDLDVVTMVWNVDWIRYALAHYRNPFFTDRVLVPFGADLRLHALAPLHGLLAFPFTPWLGALGAFNVVLVASLFLNGALMWWLAERETGHRAGSLIAAVWFMLGAPLLVHFRVGRPSFACLWVVCGALASLGALLDRPRWWTGAALGLFLLAALLTDFQLVLVGSVWLAVYAGARLAQERGRLLTRAHVGALVLGGLLFAVPFLAVFYPALAAAGRAGYPSPGLEMAAGYSFAVRHYLTPGAMRHAYGYELAGAAIVAVLTFRWRGGYRVWLAGSLVFLVLALGPYLSPTGIRLPFAALSGAWPPLAQFRTPGRLTAAASLGLAVVAAFALAAWLPRLRASWLVAAVALVAVAGRLAYALAVDPYPVHAYPAYRAYEAIAREPGDFTVLEVPFGVRSGLERVGLGGEALLYYELAHGKRVVNAMIARLPSRLFAGYRAHPALVFLSGEPTPAPPPALERDLEEVLRWTGTRYVVVHGSWLTAERREAIERLLDGHAGLERRAVERDLVVYRARSAP